MKDKRKSRKIVILMLFCLLQVAAYAQEKTVTGRVTSADGEGLPGATVAIKGTTSGTVADFNGNFSITVPDDNAILVFSYVGCTSMEQSVSGVSNINVTLEEDLMQLEEVVVTGYGVAKKSDITGSMATLKADDFNVGVGSSPEQLMQGRIAGVQITSNNGEPGAGVKVQIRGANSIRSNTMPLYVIDGVPLDIQNSSPDGATAAGLNNTESATNPLNFLNSNDIESIDVLKDASAAAIYGARGANGVVIITTKKGKEGSALVSYSFTGSIANLNKKLEVLSADEFVRYREDSLGTTEDNFGATTDWQDEIFRTAFTHDHSLSLSGGTQATQYRASFGYLDQQGIIEKSDMNRFSGRINLTQKALKNRLVVECNLTASQVNENRVPIGGTTGYEGDLLTNAIQANPTMPVYNDDGSYFQDIIQSKRNPVAMVNLTDDITKTNRILANISGTLEIVKGLNFKTNLGLDNSVAVRRVEQSRLLNYMTNDQGTASLNNRELQSWLLEYTLQYTRTLAQKHNISLLAGFSYQNFNIRGYNIYTREYTTDEIKYVNNLEDSDPTQGAPSAYATKNELQSFFGRINYNYNEKYLLTATIRRDGSTKFGENNKYGNFPSVALAWRITQEEFMQNLNVFSNLKLRVGWGLTGNQEIGEKYSLFTIGTSDGAKGIMDGISVIPGYVLSRTPSPDIKWESSAQTNIGLDFGVFEGRLSGTIDLFQKKTTNMLLEVNSKQPAPTSTQMANIEGYILNKGIEVGLTGYVIAKKDFTWTMGVNFSAIKNMVDDLPVTQITTGTASGAGLTGVQVQVIKNGEPINSFYGPKWRGFNEAGMNLFEAENGHDTTNASYKQLLGSPLPKFTYSISNSFTYKSFDLSFFLQGVQGNLIYNNTANAIGTVSNISIGNNTFPDVILTNESPSNSTVFSDRFLEEGSYLRLSNATLGYNLPLKPGGWISNLRLSLMGNNLLILTNYSGYDPDVNTDAQSGSVASLGIDNTNYPKARSFALGLNVTF
jgi:TonB-dependent starch-binding outer membrane protein SusC